MPYAENRINEYLEKRKMTKAELTRQLGGGVWTIQRICKYAAGSEPGVKTAIKIAAALKTTVEHLWPSEEGA